MLIGATVLSLLSYTAQIILYVIRIITLFLDRKVSLDAVCYCASLMSYATESVIHTTHQLVTSTNSDTKNSPTRTTDMLSMNTGAIVEAENTEQIIPCQESSYWCLCDVPFGIYPLGVSTGDPSTIDAAFLSNFLSWDYDGDVATHTVNTDTFCLSAEFFDRRHYFKKNTTFRYVVLTSMGVSIFVAMVLNLLILFPRTKTSKTLVTVKFICVSITNVPYLFVRVWLLIEYSCSMGAQSLSSFFVFLIVESLMLMFGVVDFGMELRSIPDEEDGRRTGSSLEKWRGYCHDLRPETTHSSSSSSMSPRVRVDLRADFGETSDDADSVFASTSSKGDSFPLGNDNLTFVQERQPRKRGVHDYGFLLNGDFNSSTSTPGPDKTTHCDCLDDTELVPDPLRDM
ncbi:hypothetical protein LSH36_503g04012 [Paralvinella palmiformis]|uniref:Uncharacterized protein n=1 Tax=Paralvinella palmiformis TaxID=53620 RepID=A0AAD9J8A7_9ANNE|nr:hypothetical protein LSH36_503g04012 [Paralvinella palmiformis]